ncbi:MAG TPA: hypothetical protein VLK33_11495, partial [Terriglobales bacterium]|nr:hypothetical protein [Terriglobales bacterium]
NKMQNRNIVQPQTPSSQQGKRRVLAQVSQARRSIEKNNRSLIRVGAGMESDSIRHSSDTALTVDCFYFFEKTLKQFSLFTTGRMISVRA